MKKQEPVSKIPLFVGLDNFSSRPGGLGRAFDSICKEFAVNGSLFQRLEIGYPFFGTEISPEQPFAIRATWLIRSAIKSRNSTSFIYGHFALHSFLVSLIIKAPLITFFHGPWALESKISEGKKSLKYRIQKLIETRVYRKSRFIHCASESFRNLLITEYGIDGNKIIICPLGVNLERFRIRSKEQARDKLSLAHDATIFIAVRRLTKRMGIEDLINSFSDFCDANSEGLLFIIGKGQDQKEYESEVRKLELEHRIKILGGVPDEDLPDWYSAADLSIVPSKNLEGFGLVALESLASGVPVLASRCGGIEEIVEKWNSRFLFDAGNRHQLTEKLQKFSAGLLDSDPQLCREFAEEFSWQKCANRIQKNLVSKKILFLSSEDVLSGAELSLIQLIDNLGSEYWPELYIGGTGDVFKRSVELGLNVEYVPSLELDFSRYSSKYQLLKAFLSLPKSMLAVNHKLRKCTSDYIFINTFKTLLVAFPAMMFGSKVVVYWAHDSFDIKGRFHNVKKLFFKFAFRMLNIHVICNSFYTAETLQKHIGIKSELVLYPFINMDPIILNPSLESGIKIGICSRITEWKGQLFAIQALMPLLLSNDAIQLDILGSPLFGDEEYAASICEFIKQNDLSSRIRLIPFMDNPIEIVGTWRLSIHSSLLPEPFGRTVAESLSVGVPVIVPNTGGLLEIAEDGVNSLAYTMGDAQDLFDKVSLFLSDDLLSTQLRKNSRLGLDKFRADRQIGIFESWLSGITL